MNVRMTTLRNGLRVITATMPHVESVSCGLWVGAGGRHEPRALSGICHFIEHMLFKGTRRRSAMEISQEVEGRGGYLNAFTQEESTCYYARVAFDQIEIAFDVLADMYAHPLFARADIEKERNVVVEEIMMYRDQPHHVVQDLLMDALWPRHPLGRPIVGTPETLGRFDAASLAGFKDRHYLPSNTVAAFAGRIEHESAVALVRSRLAGLRRRRAGRAEPVTRAVRQQGEAIEARDIEQVHVAMGLRLFGRHDRRRYVLRILNAVLGENMSSRLFQVVREKYGLAYSIHSSAQLFDDTGALMISAGLDRKRSERALQLVARELRRLREKNVGRGELSRAKEYVLGQIRLGLESTSHQMMWVGDNILSQGRFVPPEEVMARVSRVSIEDVRAVAQSCLRPAALSLAVVAPGLKPADKLRLGGAVREF